MAAQLLDGRATAATLREETAAEAAAFMAGAGVAPALAVVMGGDDPASRSYVRAIGREAGRANMRCHEVAIEPGADDAALRALVQRLNGDPAIHGVIVQFPLPPPLSQAAVAETLDPGKDVDGITIANAGRLALGQPGFVPSTALGGMELLRRYGIPLHGVNATVVGRGPTVGKPMALLLLNAHATVTICHSRTPPDDLAAACRRAGVLCAGVGQPGLITRDMVKPGAVVVDFGTTPGPGGSLVGDVDFAGASEVAAWITPVPGGAGPMTTAMLLRNTLAAARAQTAAATGAER